MKIVTKTLALIAVFLLGLLASGILNLLSAKPKGAEVILLPPPSPSPIRVHVTGAVAEPGVYILPPNSIIKDAIHAAGGSLPDADLQSINLAAPVSDGQQIFIGSHQEISATPQGSLSSITHPSTKMNINTATAPELEELPGIGPSLAQKIIEYRQQNGPFHNLEDLLKVSGIGPAKLEQIQDLIVVR